MDANQLAEALARAVEISKPAQEYCLFKVDHWATCMTKAEWSGWVQAAGSVIAILASAFLLRYQMMQERLRIKRAAVVRTRSFVAFLSAYIELYLELANYSALDMRRLSSVTREQVGMASGIPGEVLNLRWIAALEGARAIAVQLSVLFDEVGQNSRMGSLLRTPILELQTKVNDIKDIVAKDHPGVRVWRNHEV